MEAYNVKVMQNALEDMTGIKEYIEEQFKEPQIALEMFDGIRGNDVVVGKIGKK